MKKTLNVNISGRPFIIDEDAYLTLKHYLDEIDIRLDDAEHTEVLEEIENRISDLFTERLTCRMQVVNLGMVQSIISILGPAQEFGEPRRKISDTSDTSQNGTSSSCPENDPTPHASESYEASRSKRFYRSRTDRLIGGVCGGLAQYFNIDPVILRIATIIITALTGIALFIYIILWIVVPLQPITVGNDPDQPFN